MRKTSSSYISGILAVLVTLGFLAVIGVIMFHEIPSVNDNHFNTALVALVGFVSLALGFYLGSSYGSARKTELLGLEAPAASSAGPTLLGGLGNDGSASPRLLLVLMASCALLAVFSISGCASMKTDPPDVLAGKSLLAMKATIVTAATAGDQLCRQRIIPQTDCALLANYYHLAQPAYDLAADSMRMVLLSKDPAAWQRYQADQNGFRQIFDDVLVMSGRFGLLGGAH